MSFPKFLGGHAGLAQLAELLEDEQSWRDKLMHWDFGTIEENKQNSCDRYDVRRHKNWCGSAGCAIGLAMKVWPENFGRISTRDEADMLGMDYDTAMQIFYNINTYDKPWDEVEPKDVAAKIREYLKEHSS